MPNPKVTTKGKTSVLRFDLNADNFRLVRNLPNQQGYVGRDLRFELTPDSIAFLETTFPTAVWDETSRNVCEVYRNSKTVLKDKPQVDFAYKTKPFEHQEKVFMRSRDLAAFALHMEQGTGKSKVISDTAAYLYANGKISGLLILAPNGVHRNWADEEIPKHMPDWCGPQLCVWDAKAGDKRLAKLHKNTTNGLKIFCVNIEAISTKRGAKAAEQFLLTYPSLIAIDESTTIKTPGAQRTKHCIKLGRYAPYRRVATGTPITKSPLDAYSQFQFLDEDILGYSSFYSFRARYAIMVDIPGKVDKRGRPIQAPVAYQNLEELRNKIKEYSYRVLKSECLDLPPKLYKRRPFQMTDEQWDYYCKMENDLEVEFEGRMISAPMAMVNQMRLAQIACGYLPSEDPEVDPGIMIGKTNRRIEAIMDDLEDLYKSETKIIIGAPWRALLRDIYNEIRSAYGSQSVVAYGGQMSKQSQDEKALAKKSFQEDDKVRCIVGMVSDNGGITRGHTLTQAGYVLIASQRYNLETRLQFEDRAHRIGLNHSVTYSDYEAQFGDNYTMDRDVIESLKKKKEIADIINGDAKLPDWMKDSTLDEVATWGKNEMEKVDNDFYSKFGGK